MGSNDFYPEEQPVRRVEVEPFHMDAHPVTNRQFARFIDETGYVTAAERQPEPADYPGVDAALLVPGSLVFRAPSRVPSRTDFRQWWSYVPGASWRQPEGPGSTLNGRSDHPVVHIAYEDGKTYARWAGKELPTEAEWEFAARGGLEGAVYTWGDELPADGNIPANIWRGEFPWQNLKVPGEDRTSPVGAFPPNGYGLYDMAGNVWEWTCSMFDPGQKPGRSCCSTSTGYSRKVVKGGSHLCAPNYCLRYRPAARQPQSTDSSASHIGFRCIRRDNR